MRSFRTRLIVTIIGLMVVTATLVAGLAYVLVEQSLRDQLVENALDRSGFNISVLASEEVLPVDADADDLDDSGLAERFLLRGSSGVFALFDDGTTYLSSLSLVPAVDVVSRELAALVANGELGYEFVGIGDEHALLVGGRRPVGGPDFYFVFSAAEVDAALSQLLRVLLVAGVIVVLLGALIAGLIARRIMRPVRTASDAAERMAAGDLATRVPGEGRDEFGRWADSFNQMAASLELKIRQLQEAQARERRFVADVSHELRTPVTGLVNEAAMMSGMLDHLPADSDERNVAALLRTDVARLRDLVEDLLEISRLDTSPDLESTRRPGDGTNPDRHDVDVAAFLRAVIADRHPAAELFVAGDPPPVVTDRRALERIVGNLLDNARLHAPGAAVSVVARLDGDRLTITVADDGPGVAVADLPHLFERFYKGDRSRQGGSGLGLAISRQHARSLGGDVSVHCGEDGGLVFKAWIPVTSSFGPLDPSIVTASLPDGDVAAKSITQPEEDHPATGGHQ